MTAMSSGQGVWDPLGGLLSGRFGEGPSVWQGWFLAKLCYALYASRQARQGAGILSSDVKPCEHTSVQSRQRIPSVGLPLLHASSTLECPIANETPEKGDTCEPQLLALLEKNLRYAGGKAVHCTPCAISTVNGKLSLSCIQGLVP